MSTKCGWASIDERGQATGGKKGDQTGREMLVGNWYNFGQNIVIRPISTDKGNKMASTMKKLCNGNKVGYNQLDRTGLFKQLKKHKWNPDKIEKCNTDCSASIGAIANCVGIKVSENIWTGNMREAFKGTGKVRVLTDKKYVKDDRYLKKGDIIVNEAEHTIMAVENGSKIVKPKKVKKKTFKAKSRCHARLEPTKKGTKWVTIPKGTKLTSSLYTSKGKGWYRITSGKYYGLWVCKTKVK